MAVAAAIRDLAVHLQHLHDGLVALRTMIREDRPLDSDSVLIDVFGDGVDDLLGSLEEALAAAEQTTPVGTALPDLERARQALMLCQDRFNALMLRFAADLACYEQLAKLLQVGRERGGEWRAWAGGVRQSLEACRPPIHDVNQALLRCWGELTADLIIIGRGRRIASR